jgi:hypothetical protein
MGVKTFDDWLIEIGLEKKAEAKGTKKGRGEGWEEGINKFAELLDQGYSPQKAKEILKNNPVFV